MRRCSMAAAAGLQARRLSRSLLFALAAAAAVASIACAATSSSSSVPTLSWSSQLSITIDAGNGSAIVKGSALVSPDHKSWAFGVVVGTNTSDDQIPVSFGIFKAVDPSSPVPTWEWKPLSSPDIASATVSFSPGEELVLLVEWRNSSSSSANNVAWSSDTGGDAQAVALTNTGQLLLLDANNDTIWQRPGSDNLGPSSAPAPLAACPANICLLPLPPSSSPPPPPRSTTKSPPSSASRAPFSALLLFTVFFMALSAV